VLGGGLFNDGKGNQAIRVRIIPRIDRDNLGGKKSDRNAFNMKQNAADEVKLGQLG